MDSSVRARAETWRPWAFDVTVAVLLVALSLTIFLPMAARNSPESDETLGLVLLVAHSGCLVWRRKAPLVVMALNLATAATFYALGFPVVALGVAILVALYTVASRTERGSSVIALVVTTVVMGVVLLLADERSDPSTVAGNAIVLGVVWFLGDSHRERRAYVLRLEERTAELERARDDLARAAAAEERLRIARELHDVVGHSMGMIAVQAGVGAHVIDARPEEAKRSLEAIEAASKSALGEIRRMLGLLRAPEEAPETDPSPGLDDLPRLADEVTRAGVAVDLRVDPPKRPLPKGVELTVYRIVQEAMTNVVRHSGAARARVSVRFLDGTARVEVVDDGAGGSPDGEGHGIAGMRERVALHGGTLEAAPLPEGGFRVSAVIPVGDGAP